MEVADYSGSRIIKEGVVIIFLQLVPSRTCLTASSSLTWVCFAMLIV